MGQSNVANMLKTIERISFYYCMVSFISLDCDCVTECTHKNAGCNHAAGRIKDTSNGADIMSCKMYL